MADHRKTDGFRIESLWAYLSIDPDDDDEGVCAFQASDGTWMPLVAADKTRLDLLRPAAEHIANQTGQRIQLSRFMRISDIEIIEPNAT